MPKVHRATKLLAAEELSQIMQRTQQFHQNRKVQPQISPDQLHYQWMQKVVSPFPFECAVIWLFRPLSSLSSINNYSQFGSSMAFVGFYTSVTNVTALPQLYGYFEAYSIPEYQTLRGRLTYFGLL